MRKSCLTHCLLLPLLIADVTATPRRISDFSSRAQIEKKVVTPSVSAPQTAERFQNNTIQLKQWHGRFSTLGQRRANLGTDNRFDADTVDIQRFPLQRAAISTSGSQVAANQQALNWNQVREHVVAAQFDPQSGRTPLAVRMQDLVDQVSLQDINRFNTVRNQTDAGIPVQDAGSGSGSHMMSDEVTRQRINRADAAPRSVPSTEGSGTGSQSSPVQRLDPLRNLRRREPSRQTQEPQPQTWQSPVQPRTQTTPSAPIRPITPSRKALPPATTTEGTTRTQTRQLDDGAVQRTRIRVRVKD